jgi:hypothetical protein
VSSTERGTHLTHSHSPWFAMSSSTFSRLHRSWSSCCVPASRARSCFVSPSRSGGAADGGSSLSTKFSFDVSRPGGKMKYPRDTRGPALPGGAFSLLFLRCMVVVVPWELPWELLTRENNQQRQNNNLIFLPLKPPCPILSSSSRPRPPRLGPPFPQSHRTPPCLPQRQNSPRSSQQRLVDVVRSTNPAPRPPQSLADGPACPAD